MFKHFIDDSRDLTLSSSSLPDQPTEEACQEFAEMQAFFCTQSGPVQEHLNGQAARLAEAIVGRLPQAEFSLPEEVAQGNGRSYAAEAGGRQRISSRNGRLAVELCKRLSRLEESAQPALRTYAVLLRYATAERLMSEHVHLETCASFEPQEMLSAHLDPARARFASLQGSLWNLQSAVRLAGYIVACEGYGEKRQGLLEQIAAQGPALAQLETQELIEAIQQRAAKNGLNRGFSLELPYYDDQRLSIERYPFEVIPSGRILFEPTYVMWVAREEQEKVLQDNRFSATTRKHLLAELKCLEKAFEVPGLPRYRRKSAQKKSPIQTRILALKLALNTFNTNKSKKNREI